MKAPTVTLPIDAPALARGVGFFETLWVLDRRPIFFEAHLGEAAHFLRRPRGAGARSFPRPRGDAARAAGGAARR